MGHTVKYIALTLGLFVLGGLLAEIARPGVAQAQAVKPGGAGGSSFTGSYSSFTATAASGNNAFTSTAGAKWTLGAANAYLHSPSSGQVWVGVDSSGVGQGELNAATVTAITLLSKSTGTTGRVITRGTAYITDDSGNDPVDVDDADGLRVAAKSSVPTCGNGTSSVREGTELRIAGSGGTYTKDCVCRYDGTTYKWFNRFLPADTSGTTTTCP